MAQTLPNGYTYKVEIAFPASAELGDVFVIGDATQGVLDSATYVLGGDIWVDVTTDVEFIKVNRGRNREIDPINAGTAVVEMVDPDRKYDANNVDSPYYRGVRPRRRIRISVNDEPIFTGWTVDWAFEYQLGGPFRVKVDAVDAFHILANTDINGYTPAGTELSHLRLGDVLDDATVNWPATERDIGTGIATVNDTAVSSSITALDYLQRLARTEYGFFFINRLGQVAWRGRTNPYTSAVMCRFGDDGDPDSVPYRRFEVDYSSDMLYNRVVITRDGGTPQVDDDTASQDEYLISTLSWTGLLFSTDAQALSLAGVLIEQHANPRTRVNRLEVQLGDAGPPWIDAIKLDLADKVRLIKKFEPGGFWPVQKSFDDTVILQTDSDTDLLTDSDVELLIDFGGELDQFLMVQSISHDINPARHVITVGLAPIYT